jgi:hypothetical protein
MAQNLMRKGIVKYEYFVAYAHLTRSGYLVGNTVVVLNAPITRASHLDNIRDAIMKDCDTQSSVVILNFILLTEA